MKKIYKYNPARDLHAVDGPLAAVDLRDAYVHGSIPAAIDVNSLGMNGVEVPDGIMTHASDVFEQYRQVAYVRSSLASRSKEPASGSAAPATDGVGSE